MLWRRMRSEYTGQSVVAVVAVVACDCLWCRRPRRSRRSKDLETVLGLFSERLLLVSGAS